MSRNEKTSSDSEGEYPGLDEVLNRYLTGERPIDDLVKDSDFRTEARKMCNGIAGDAERGKDLFQSFCQQLLRRDSEGPLKSSKPRPKALRAGDLRTPEEFRGYLYKSAKNLARSKWRKRRRRREIAPTRHLTPDDFHRLSAREIGPEARCMLGEALSIINDLPRERRLACLYWLEFDYSARQIAQLLNIEGIPCTHVTVQTWIKDVLSKLRGRRVTSIKKAS
jgi:DNA-directed RNA polymerase specialized sigma24 family protein